MHENEYGQCEVCGSRLIARHLTFNRHVEKYHYGQVESDLTITIEVLSAETLTVYCCSTCAWPDMLVKLSEQGIRHTGCGSGPIEVCSKCGGPVIMAQPHIAYTFHDETEFRDLSITRVQVNNAEVIAKVCVRCDGDVEADAANLHEEVESATIIQQVY